MHRLLSTVTAVAALASVIAATGLAAASGDGVWVNGVRHQLVTGPPAGTSARPTPLYVIAPVHAADPLHALANAELHGFGAHDHVIGSRPAGSATCDLQLVVPGPKAKLGRTAMARRTLTPAGAKPLLYAARIGNRVEPLDWASRIRSAAASGVARVVDTHILVGCTVT